MMISAHSAASRLGICTFEGWLTFPWYNAPAMAENNNKTEKPRTHTAFAIQQKRVRRLVFTQALEVGDGRIENNRAQIF